MGEIHISGCAGIVARLLSRTACSECWSHFKHLRGEATFSRTVRKINLNCPHVIPNPFLILSIFFPNSPKNPQTLHLAQGRWRDAPRSAAARAETFQAIGTGTGGTTFGAGGTEGRAEREDGDEIMGKMDQWRGWSNNERRWGYRADFILSFLIWNSLP